MERNDKFVKQGFMPIWCPCGFANEKENAFDAHMKVEHEDMYKLYLDFSELMRPSFQKICLMDFRQLGATADADNLAKSRLRDLYVVRFTVKKQDRENYKADPKHRERKRIARDFRLDRLFVME